MTPLGFTLNLRIAAVAAVILLTGSASFAQVPAALDLASAVEKAITNDPLTRKAAVSVKAASAKAVEARSQRMPSLQFSQSFTRSNNPVFVFGSLLEQGRFKAANFALDALNHPDALNNFRTAADLRYTVYDKGLTDSAVKRANIGRTQAELSVEAARQRTTFEVIRNYYSAILASEMVRVTDEAVKAATENRRKASDLVAVGMAVESDSLAADVELAAAEQHRIEARAALTTTLAALNIAIGSKPESVPQLTGTLQERFFPVAEQDELIRAALAERPDIRQAELAIASGREQTRAVKLDRRPRVDAFAGLGYSSPYITNGSSDYTVGASLTYTIFDAGRRSREEQAADAVSMAELDLEALSNQVKLEVVRSLQNHLTARSKIQVSIRSISQAEEAVRIIQDRYRFGLSTFSEVLRAESALVRAKHDLLKARCDYLVSYAALQLATGRLTDTRLFE